MADTLTFSATAILTTEADGTTVSKLNPPISRTITVDPDCSLYTVTVAANASATSILPPNAAEGDEIWLFPDYQDQAGSLVRSMDCNITVTGPTTTSHTFKTFTGFKVPASMTALTLDNNDASNSVNVQVMHFRRSA
jgi:hypothetical protein